MNRTRPESGVRLTIMLLILGALLAACGSQPVTSPAGGGQSSPAASSTPVEPQTSSAPKPAGDPPQQPVRRPGLPAAAILAKLDETGWQFDRLQPHLPDLEGSYQATNGEETTELECAYQGGTLRLIVSPADRRVIAVLFDTRNPDFREAALWQSSEYRRIKVQAPYVAVVRTRLLDQAGFAALLGHLWSLEGLRKQLGEPSYQVHLHGVGSMVYTYLPEGLTWIGAPSSLQLVGDKAASPGADKSVVPPYPYDDYKQKAPAMWESFAGRLIARTVHMDQIMTRGKASPDGRYRVILDEHGGYWGNWLIIREQGKAEQRYNTAYFVDGYEWLYNDTLIFLEKQTGNQFYTIDVTQRKMGPTATVPAGQSIKQWGVVSPGHIWYEGPDGVRQELRIP